MKSEVFLDTEVPVQMDGTFLDCSFGSNFHHLGLSVPWLPFCGSVELAFPCFRVAGGINSLKPAKCLGTVVMWVEKEREMK